MAESARLRSANFANRALYRRNSPLRLLSDVSVSNMDSRAVSSLLTPVGYRGKMV
jgi:hypothetical protein